MSRMRLKKDDLVVVLSGRNKGKRGKILKMMPQEGKVIIEGDELERAKRHTKPRRQGEEGGIIKKDVPMYLCKVQCICPKCDRPTRIGHRVTVVTGSDGKQKRKNTRICKRCGAEF